MTALQTPLQDSSQDAAPPTLSREAARAVIVGRLRALGHPPDLLDSQAVAALTDHAGGSGMRLRAALAATLFLASTEDAPRIGRALVQRALLETGDIPPAPPAAAPRSWRRFAVPGAALACAGLALAVLVLRPPARDLTGSSTNDLHQTEPSQPPRPVQAPADQKTPVPPQQAARQLSDPPRSAAPPITPAPASAEPAQPARAPATPIPVTPIPAAPISAVPATPLPAPSSPMPAVTAQPEPAAEAPPEAAAAVPPDLPASPSASVVLIVSARDPAAVQRLDGLMQHLRAAGIAQIATQPSSTSRARRPISYFFADDLPLAQRITQVLAGEGWPHLTSNSLTPRLVIPPPGIAPRQPGLIEIQLP